MVDSIISDEQRQRNSELHQSEGNYGNRSDGAGVARHLPEVLLRLHESGLCNSVLDYGTGKGKLTERLRNELPAAIKVKGYDPSVPKYNSRPEGPFDIITCLDVLEHIEMDSIDAVLRDIHTLTNNICYLVIDLQPAVKTLSDGRNAHILLAPSEWWITRVSQLFPCISSFPIMHDCGIPQKIVIGACKKNTNIPYMYLFLTKMKLFGFTMRGGILAKLAKN